MFPTAENTADQGERAYDNALPWDQVKPARYYPANAPVGSFAAVKERHEQRLKQNRLFQLLLDDLALKREASDKKEVSLLEHKRKQEREKMLAAKRKIQNAMRKEKGLPPLAEEDEPDADETAKSEQEETIDVLLNETANILRDLIVPPDDIDTRTVSLK